MLKPNAKTLHFQPFTPNLVRNWVAIDASKIQVNIKSDRGTVPGLWSLNNPSDHRRRLSSMSQACASHVGDVDENLWPNDTDGSNSDTREEEDVVAGTVTKWLDLAAGAPTDQLQHANLNDQGFSIGTA